MRQVIRLRLRRAAGQGLAVDGGGAAGAALVEQQHPVVLQGPVQPAFPAFRALRPEPRAALQEHQPGQVRAGLAGRDHLAGEYLDLLAVRPGMIKRDGEQAVGEHGTRVTEADHGPTVPCRSRCGSLSRVVGMGTVIRPVSVAERRARLAGRHHLAPASRGTPSPAGVAGAAADIIALHGTDPASVYLAAWAR